MLARHRSRLIHSAYMMIAMVGTAATASADMVTFESLPRSSGTYGQTARYTGSLTVDQLSTTPNTARVTVSLTNTTPVAGWYLVGFGMNNPALSSGGTVTKVNYTGDAAYPNLLGIGYNLSSNAALSNKVSTGVFGNLDFGFGLGRIWHTSGSASDGIAVGDTGTFVYDVTTNGTVTARSIFDTLSTGGGLGEASMAVRFRRADGLAPKGDKLAARETFTPPPPNPVPAPAGLILAGIAGVCGLGYRRRNAG